MKLKYLLSLVLLIPPAPQVLEVSANAVGIIRVQSQPKIDLSNRLVTQAQSWVGREFKPGQSARCADFVRSVAAEIGVQLPITKDPIDKETPNPETANSFFGNDIGQIISDPDQLKPGDLVAFGGTYGGYPASTITHVGIYIGNGQMIDRPTANEPVKQRPISTFKHFVAGVKMHAVYFANN